MSNRKFNKPDYGLKSEVLKTELPALQREISHIFYMHDVKHDCEDTKFSNALFLDELLREEKPLYWEEARKINHASFNRNTRLYYRIKSMLQTGNCLFLTLTFTDEVLHKTNEQTRRKYVIWFLGQFKTKYIANIDFGKKNGREHYHAVIQLDEIDHKLWLYGAINFERVRYNPNDSTADAPKRLAKYTSKLTNHAIKETAKRQAMIYSRSAW